MKTVDKCEAPRNESDNDKESSALSYINYKNQQGDCICQWKLWCESGVRLTMNTFIYYVWL